MLLFIIFRLLTDIQSEFVELIETEGKKQEILASQEMTIVYLVMVAMLLHFYIASESLVLMLKEWMDHILNRHDQPFCLQRLAADKAADQVLLR